MAQHFSLAACDVVGFDLDHTLCRYNLPESAPVSGAGCPERTARSLHGGWGWNALPPPWACRRRRRPPGRRAPPPAGDRAEVCIPAPRLQEGSAEFGKGMEEKGKRRGKFSQI